MAIARRPGSKPHKPRIKRTPINEKTHSCWGQYAAKSEDCQYCRADLECHLEKEGEL